MQIKTKGIVLKQRNIGENDRIITILSSELGLIEVNAKNVKTTKSAIGASTQILTYTDFCLFKSKSSYIVNSAETINTFYDLRLDVVKLSLAGYFCELIAYLCSSDDDNAQSYIKLMLNTLHFLQQDKRDPVILKCIFELRALTIAGFMPNLVCCSECAVYEDDIMNFLPVQGIIICSACSKKLNPATTAIVYPLSSNVLSAMRFIIFSEMERIFNFRLTGISAKQLSFVSESYTLLHTEAKFKSLEMYNSLIATLE